VHCQHQDTKFKSDERRKTTTPASPQEKAENGLNTASQKQRTQKAFSAPKVQDKSKMQISTNECTLFVSLSPLLAYALIKIKAKELQLSHRKCMNAQDCSWE